jgi:HEAT repeat protein
MNQKPIQVRIKYNSPEAFLGQYLKYIKNSAFHLTASQAPAVGTPIELIILIPGFDDPFVIGGFVTSVVNLDNNADPQPKKGITIRFDTIQAERVQRLTNALSRSDTYRRLLESVGTEGRAPARQADGSAAGGSGGGAGPVKGAISSGASLPTQERRFEWLRNVISDRDSVPRMSRREAAMPPPVISKTDHVRRDFAPEERERMKPVAAFILDLAKAMLRSGYYAPEHPGSKKAKEGIYTEFKTAVGDRPDVTLTSQESQGRFDVLISGILDDQVSLRGLIGIEQAEIYMPKLKDYFTRKNLVSFSVKRNLPLPHFEDFIDIMSDPARDRGVEGEVGNLLTSALVERGITEVSAIFVDDLIIFELKLPWRVEMAIQRLAKDLKVLPLFKDKTPEEIQDIKINIIRDIMRPLREPHMLKDIVVNAHVIARNVAAVDAEDLERTIVKTFPMEILLPTSRYVFEELARLKEELVHKPGHKGLMNRLESVKRILKWISSRVLDEKMDAGNAFFEQLYFQEILTYDELPDLVKDHVNTLLLVKDYQESHDFYVEKFAGTDKQDEVLLFLRFFRRILPFLLERRQYDLISLFNRAISAKFGDHPEYRNSELAALRAPVQFIWKDSFDILGGLFEQETKEARDTIQRIVKMLGPSGVSILIHIILESTNKHARRSAVETLSGMGEAGRAAIIKILSSPGSQWYVYRNALLAFSRLGKPGESQMITRFLNHDNPRVREEAIAATCALEGTASEPKLVKALFDPDLGVRRRSVVCIGGIPLTSPRVVSALIGMLAVEEEGSPEQKKELTDLKVETIGALSLIGNRSVGDGRTVEEVLLEQVLPEKKLSKKILEKITPVIKKKEPDYVLQTAVLKALWKVGTNRVLPGLSEFITKADAVMVNRAKETIRQIQMRQRSGAARAPV